jgi:hypothetical protein
LERPGVEFRARGSDELGDLTKAVGQGVPGSTEHQMMVAESSAEKSWRSSRSRKRRPPLRARAAQRCSDPPTFSPVHIYRPSFTLCLASDVSSVEPPDHRQWQLGWPGTPLIAWLGNPKPLSADSVVRDLGAHRHQQFEARHPQSETPARQLSPARCSRRSSRCRPDRKFCGRPSGVEPG